MKCLGQLVRIIGHCRSEFWRWHPTRHWNTRRAWEARDGYQPLVPARPTVSQCPCSQHLPIKWRREAHVKRFGVSDEWRPRRDLNPCYRRERPNLLPNGYKTRRFKPMNHAALEGLYKGLSRRVLTHFGKSLLPGRYQKGVRFSVRYGSTASSDGVRENSGVSFGLPTGRRCCIRLLGNQPRPFGARHVQVDHFCAQRPTRASVCGREFVDKP